LYVSFAFNQGRIQMKNWIIILLGLAGCTTVQEYSTCETWDELVAGDNFQYVTPGFMTNSNLTKPAGMHLA
jgi:hypothetical protein